MSGKSSGLGGPLEGSRGCEKEVALGEGGQVGQAEGEEFPCGQV